MLGVRRTLGLAGVGLLILAFSGCAGRAPASPVSAVGAAAAENVAGTTSGSAPGSTGGAAPATSTGSTAKPRPTPSPHRTRSTTAAAKRERARPGPAPRAALHASGTWKRAFAAKAGAAGCDLSYAQMRASGTARITSGSTTLFVGFQQYGNNQDPVFARFDGTRKVYCEHHEHQSPDGRALGLTWNGGPTAYVVYTVVGGGTELESKAARGWIPSYGNGGASSAVTVVGQVEVRFGTLQRASFVVARVVKNGQPKTNTIVPVAAPVRTAAGTVGLLARSAYSPLNPDRSQMCTGDGQYPSAAPGRADQASYVALFSADLHSVTCATTWGCMHVRKPCPPVG